MAESRENFAASETLPATDLNAVSSNANDGGGFRDDINAGATISGGTTPAPVYQDTSDNELYECDASDVSKIEFIGFAISNSTDGNAIDFQESGIVRGFSGLSEGEQYYVQDGGGIGTSIGTYVVPVGIAVTTTELALTRTPRKDQLPASASDDLLVSADTARSTTVAGTGWELLKEVEVKNPGEYRFTWDHKTSDASATAETQIRRNGTAVGTIKSTTSTSYVSVSDDVDGWSPGDLAQLYARDSDANETADVRNFRVKGTIGPQAPTVNTD